MRSRICAQVLALSLLTSLQLHGLGIRIADQDPFATARGNAFVATADNPSAVYYNPAGITQMEGLNASAGIYAITLGSTYTSPGGAKFDTKDEFDGLPQVYGTYSLGNLPLSVGAGLYSPYGLGLEWPDNTGFSALAKEGRILYLTFNPVIAWKILPSLSIAAGPTLNYSEAKLSQGVPGFVGDIKFKGDDTDVGFNLGLLWQPCTKISLGASYRSPTTLNYSGHTNLLITAPFTLAGSGPASASFRFPRNIIAGLSYRPTTNWNFEVDIDWTDWDSLNTVYLKPSTGPGQPLPFNWKSSFFYELGATRFFENGFHVSGGYIYSENSVPESSFNPAVPDSDRHIFSLGVGKRYQQFHWDAAYQFAWGPSRNISNPSPAYNSAANGSYEFFSHAISVSLGYTF